MCGQVVYNDGHTEDILTFVQYSDNHVTFVAQSGTYHFTSYLVAIDVGYEMNHTGAFMHRVYEFYKEKDNDFIIAPEIQYIQLDKTKIGKEQTND